VIAGRQIKCWWVTTTLPPPKQFGGFGGPPPDGAWAARRPGGARQAAAAWGLVTEYSLLTTDTDYGIGVYHDRNENITKDIKWARPTVRALDGVSLKIEDGGSHHRPSGSGRSTLWQSSAVWIHRRSGSYQLDGIDVARMRDDQLAACATRDRLCVSAIQFAGAHQPLGTWHLRCCTRQVIISASAPKQRWRLLVIRSDGPPPQRSRADNSSVWPSRGRW